MKKKIQKLKSDKDAERFLTQDLTEFIELENFKKVSFEFLPKTKQVNLRFPELLLSAVRRKAKKEGISYQRYIRKAVEESLTSP
ncbi:MAG: CopG family antitoxin [Nitrospirales bacterium]|nr:CopG family antitoxin [Nitrospirales bacterium]